MEINNNQEGLLRLIINVAHSQSPWCVISVVYLELHVTDKHVECFTALSIVKS